MTSSGARVRGRDALATGGETPALHRFWRYGLGGIPEYNDNAAVCGQRLGNSQSSGQGTGAGSGPDQRHHAGHGVDDRLGHLHRVSGDRREVGFAGSADRRLGRGRIHDDCGRAQLRRAGRDDAAGRRAVRLSARSAWAAVGISLRLDSVPGHSDRNDCRGRRGFRQVSRRVRSLDLFVELASAYLESPAHSRRPHGARQHGRRHQHAEPGRDPAGDLPFGREHLWSEDRCGDSEHLHRGEGFRAAGTGGIRIRARTQRAGSCGEFRRTSGTTPDSVPSMQYRSASVDRSSWSAR